MVYLGSMDVSRIKGVFMARYKITKELFDRLTQMVCEEQDGIKLESDVKGFCEPPVQIICGKNEYDKRLFSVIWHWMGPNGEIDKENNHRFYEYYAYPENLSEKVNTILIKEGHLETT